MGAIVSYITNLLKDDDCQMLIIGLDSAGKSTIINAVSNPNDANNNLTTPTIGFMHRKFTINNVKFTAFDMGGQAKYKTMWVDFVPGIELVVFVVDCADRERLSQAVESFWDVAGHIDLEPNCGFVIAANKQDISGSLKGHELEEPFKLSELRNGDKKHPVRVVETSASTGMGISELFDKIKELRSIQRNI